MSDLFDYLEWRGDLTFEQDSFHDLDALVLSQVSYFLFETIMAEEEEMTLADAWKKMKDQPVSSRFTIKTDRRFFEALAKSRRYQNLIICHVSHKLDDESEIQFAAVTILLPNGTPYVAFRGTDMSIVGWKEDFHLAFAEAIPAQLCALKYLKEIVEIYRRPLYVGGHSKGGNLALYASVLLPKRLQDQIRMVYVHDGPGLTETLFHSDGYVQIKDRLQVILPEESIVGILLMYPEKYSVVKSTASGGVLQHNPYTWQVLATRYVLAEGRKKESHYIETVTKRWVEETNEEELREVVEALFGLLQSSDAESLDELVKEVRKNPKALLQALRSGREEKNKAVRQTIGTLAETAFQEASAEFRETTSELTAGITAELKEATSEIYEKGKDLTRRNVQKIRKLLPGKNSENSEENEITDKTE